MIIIVTYELGAPVDRPEFFNVLKQHGPWAHYIRDTWFIATDKKPQEIFETLRPHVASADRIFVARMGNARQGWLPEKAWEWIKKHEQGSGDLPFPQQRSQG